MILNDLTDDLIETSKLSAAITLLYGKSNHIVKKTPVSGGSINQTFALRLASGTKLFLKINQRAPRSFFKIEAASLLIIKNAGAINVPAPLAYWDSNDLNNSEPSYFLLEWITSESNNASSWEALGKGLAILHQSTAKSFGLSFDNYIGRTHQSNKQNISWIEFFKEERLRVQLNLAIQNGLADNNLIKMTEKLLSQLQTHLAEPASPSLLHGDLWAGNILPTSRGASVFDPAIYYGHPEADLAMTELFGKFDLIFYAAYHGVSPIDPGYEDRKGIYQIYQLFNHLNMFGKSYHEPLSRLLQQYIVHF